MSKTKIKKEQNIKKKEKKKKKISHPEILCKQNFKINNFKNNFTQKQYNNNTDKITSFCF